MVPGVVLDSIALAGVIGVSIYYKDEIKASWNKIVKVMTDFCGSKIKPIMNKILKKMEDLPGEDEFHNFGRHYNDHGADFAYMPGGNGKKPNEKRYWEMAKRMLRSKSERIIEGQDVKWSQGNRRIKFNTYTCEYLVYELKTKKIITYYLPKAKKYINKEYSLSRWRAECLKYFLRHTKK